MPRSAPRRLERLASHVVDDRMEGGAATGLLAAGGAAAALGCALRVGCSGSSSASGSGAEIGAAADSSLRRYTAPWVDFGDSPISTVTVDTVTGVVTLAGLVCDDVVPCDGRSARGSDARGSTAAECKVVLSAVADLLASIGTPMGGMTNCLVHVDDIDDFAGINEAFVRTKSPPLFVSLRLRL